MANHDITFRYLSQETLIEAGAFDIPMVIGAVKRGHDATYAGIFGL